MYIDDETKLIQVCIYKKKRKKRRIVQQHDEKKNTVAEEHIRKKLKNKKTKNVCKYLISINYSICIHM
jgi:hypothetical protein